MREELERIAIHQEIDFDEVMENFNDIEIEYLFDDYLNDMPMIEILGHNYTVAYVLNSDRDIYEKELIKWANDKVQAGEIITFDEGFRYYNCDDIREYININKPNN